MAAFLFAVRVSERVAIEFEPSFSGPYSREYVNLTARQMSPSGNWPHRVNLAVSAHLFEIPEQILNPLEVHTCRRLTSGTEGARLNKLENRT